MSFGLANVLNQSQSVHRWFLEKTARDPPRKDPARVRQLAVRRVVRRERTARRGEPGETETVIFPTCYVNNNDPRDWPRHARRDGRANEVEVRVRDKGYRMLWHARVGARETSMALRRRRRGHVLDQAWTPARRQAGSKVHGPPADVRDDAAAANTPTLIDEEDSRSGSRKWQRQSVDPGEYLWSIRKEDRFNTDYQEPAAGWRGGVPRSVSPSGAGESGFRGRDLMKKIDGIKKIDHRDGVLRPRRHLRDEGGDASNRRLGSRRKPARSTA